MRGVEPSADPRLSEPAEEPTSVAALAAALPAGVRRQLAASQRRADIDSLMSAALAGDLPRDRELHYWEPEKLNPTHLQMVLLRAAGLRNSRIAELVGATESNVSVVLRHPDSQFLLSRLISYASDEVLDIDARLSGLLGESVDTLAECLRFGKPGDSLRAKVAFGILDRKGYGAEKKAKVTHEVRIPARQLGLLATALREADGLQREVVADYTVRASELVQGPAAVSGQEARTVESAPFAEVVAPESSREPRRDPDSDPESAEPTNCTVQLAKEEAA